MAAEHHLETTRTARYFTLGELNSSTKEVWLVLHGYAQLATDFISQFETLDNGTRFFVAPEGLNRFYAKGFGGKPAASWMTSEDRLNEIKDYVSFLDRLYKELSLENTSAKIVLLGFSQGVATASRWLHHTRFAVHHFMICSGEIGAELRDPVSPKLLSTPVTYFTGSNDPFMTPEKQDAVTVFMQSINASIIPFEGVHEVRTELLTAVAV